MLIAAYIMHAKKQRAAAVMLVCAAAGLLRVAGYAFLGARRSERNYRKRLLFAQSYADSAYANGLKACMRGAMRFLPKLRLSRGNIAGGQEHAYVFSAGMRSAQAEYRHAALSGCMCPHLRLFCFAAFRLTAQGCGPRSCLRSSAYTAPWRASPQALCARQ